MTGIASAYLPAAPSAASLGILSGTGSNMSDGTRAISLVGISGSIRKGSFTTAVLRSVAATLAHSNEAEMTLFALDEVPPYNSDLEGDGAPAPVMALRAAIESSDGIVLASPEYNYGMSGVLKNALDWASRPAFASPMKDKPCLVITVSPAWTGGVRAQQQMRDTLMSMLARVIAAQEIVVADVHRKIIDGVFRDEANGAFIATALALLVREVTHGRHLAAAGLR